MEKVWIDQERTRRFLSQFFDSKQKDLKIFGNTVNQTFEAFVFASVINWYRKRNWNIQFQHPKKSGGMVRLKYSTRGRPDNFTYAKAVKGKKKIEIRHNIRIRSAYSNKENPIASFVIDVGVIKCDSVKNFSTNDAVENRNLITFAEAKHMNAFAELISGFIGTVHELLPKKLKKHKKSKRKPVHPFAFLFVSGFSNPSARGVIATITKRGYRIKVYDINSKELHGIPLQNIPTRPAGVK